MRKFLMHTNLSGAHDKLAGIHSGVSGGEDRSIWDTKETDWSLNVFNNTLMVK